MTRYLAFVFVFCLVISGICSAQTVTREEVDSLKTVYLKALKKLPAADPSVMKYRSDVLEPDTLHFSRVQAYAPEAAPAIFETAFFKGTRAIEDSMNLDFYAVDIGLIAIETGKIVACDPIQMNGAKPFLQTFPVGTFPVQLAIARFGGGTAVAGAGGMAGNGGIVRGGIGGSGGGIGGSGSNGDERVAFSRICFSEKPVVRWEFALQDGNRPLPIDGDTLYGYGVDEGMGIFIDAAANAAFDELHKFDNNLWNAVFTNEMSKHDHITWQYTLFAFQQHNLACFSTGVGDGLYGSYVGYDKQGLICRLLTDFGLVRWWKK